MSTVPDLMTAMVLTGHGSVDQLVLRDDWPVPDVGRADVLVRVAACGLNNTDINTRTGWYSGEVDSGVTIEDARDGFDGANVSEASWGGRRRCRWIDVRGPCAPASARRQVRNRWCHCRLDRPTDQRQSVAFRTRWNAHAPRTMPTTPVPRYTDWP